ncbi:YihY/virulence factor BrkB family protein [Nocardioides sp. GY 10113]|uniref:YihY/virulence factor BrkB family protein n=1 Tax=Nocardioides sp. GY 10113 TaxID=2569761 RepID=UPI0010A93DFC|nr:YhjD/YihY/BrkB family envelope integrity protein [Nocardioides sp. GY 10113]TIC86786.1 YihY/virulence factor BrkB family protein [Nocardioides sp. GY 10113]
MTALADQQAKARKTLATARRKGPLLDHVIRTVQHYGNAKGSLQAGGITYFGFISFFPILALAFAVVGYVARIFPDAEDNLVTALNSIFPGLIGNGDGQISLDTISSAAPSIASIGLLVVLYSGLGWLSNTRSALLVMFDLPSWDQPSFVIGKLRDLMTLAVLGVVLIASVGLSGALRGLSQQILDWIGLGADLGWLLNVTAVVFGLAVNTLLFYAMFRLLARPDLPQRALISGAVLGGIAFEVLKQVSQWLLQSTSNSPAFQAFGIALILVIWINYVARVLMYAAAWAYTAPSARGSHVDHTQLVLGPQLPPGGLDEGGRPWVGPFAAGAAAMLAVVAVVRRRR